MHFQCVAGLVLSGDKEINEICSSSNDIALKDIADRLFDRAGAFFWSLDPSVLRTRILQRVTSSSFAVNHAEATFHQVFSDISAEDARQLSATSRAEDSLSANGDFTYGEINFRSFASILRGVHTTPGSRLLDLGAGIGKPVIAAALLFDFQACVGIEQLRGLYKVACSRPKRLLRLLQGQGGLPEDLPDMEFSNTSFFDTSWRDYDVVFLSSTTFTADTLTRIATKSRELPHGAMLISLTHPLNAPHLKEQSRRTLDMSWGPAMVIVHRRIPTSNAAPPPPSYTAQLSDSESDAAAGGGGRGGTGHALPSVPASFGTRVRVPSYASSDSMGLFDVDHEVQPEVDVMDHIHETPSSHAAERPPLAPGTLGGVPPPQHGRAVLKKSFSMSSQGTFTLEGVDDRISPPSTPSRGRSSSDTDAALASPAGSPNATPFASPAVGARQARVADMYGGGSSPQAEGLLQRRRAKRMPQGSRLGAGVSPAFAPAGAGAMGMPPLHMGGPFEGGARGLSSPMDRSLRQRNAQRQAAGPLRERLDSSGSAEGPQQRTYVTPPKPASAASLPSSQAMGLPDASSPQGTRLLQQRAARQAALPRGSLLQGGGHTPSRTTYSDSSVTPPQPASSSAPAFEGGARGLSSPMDRSLRQRNAQRQAAGPLRERLDSLNSMSSSESLGGLPPAHLPLRMASDTSTDQREDVSSPMGSLLRRSRGAAPPPSRALGDPQGPGSASPLMGASPAPAQAASEVMHTTPQRSAAGVQGGGASSPMGRSLLQARNAGAMPRGGPLKLHMRQAESPIPGSQEAGFSLSSPPPQVRLAQHNKYLQTSLDQQFSGSASPQGDALLRRRQMAHQVGASSSLAPRSGPLAVPSSCAHSTPVAEGSYSDTSTPVHGSGHASAFQVSPSATPPSAEAGPRRNVSAFAVDEEGGVEAGRGGYPTSRNDTTLSMDEEADIVTALSAGEGGGAHTRVGVRTRYSDADNGIMEGSL